MKASGMSLALRCWLRRQTPQLDSLDDSLPSSSSLPAPLELPTELQLLELLLLQSLSSPLSWNTK